MTLYMALVTNGIAVVLLLVLLLSSSKERRVRLVDDRLFEVMVLLTVLQCILETVGFAFDGREGEISYYMNYIFSTLCFMNNSAFAFIWAAYSDFKMYGDKTRLKKYYPFVAIPAAIVWVGCIVNFFTPVFFSITPVTNAYSRTLLFPLIYLIIYVYIFYGVIMVYVKGRRDRAKAMPALLFVVPILIGSIMQFLFYGLSLISVGAAIALVSLYITLQGQASYVDTLSGLYSRNYLKICLDSYLRKRNQDSELAGIILDINRFKQINDQHGHLVGDDAIKTMGTVLLKSIPQDAAAVRYGGDEFLVLLWIKDRSDIQTVIDKIQSNLDEVNASGEKPYEIACSCGYDVYDRDRDFFNNFFARMDAIMYENKQKARENEENA